MQIEVIKATEQQKPLLAQLLELYAYDFTEFRDFDIGDDGFYGHKRLPLYWTEPTRFPYLIYVDKKIAGFILMMKGSPISENKEIWDISEFFIMRKYRRHGVGATAAQTLWAQFPGPWQVRVLTQNHIACSFWLKSITQFSSSVPTHSTATLNGDDWIIYNFESQKPIVS